MTRKKREGRFSSWYLLFLPLIDQEHKPLTKTWHSLCKNIRIYVWITVRWPNDPANRSFLVTRREDDFAKFISRGCRCKTNYLQVPSFSHFFRQSPESRDNPSIASKPIRSVGQAPLVSRLAHRRYQLQLKATWPASQPAKLKENEPDGFYDLLRKGWTLVQGKLCSFCERQKGRDTEGYMYCSCVLYCGVAAFRGWNRVDDGTKRLVVLQRQNALGFVAWMTGQWWSGLIVLDPTSFSVNWITSVKFWARSE